MSTASVPTSKPVGGITVKSDPRAVQFKHLLDSEQMQKSLRASLPRHLSSERFVRVVLGVLGQSKELLNCTPESVLLSLMRAAAMGLEPDGGPLGQGYLVPFGKECTFIPGYRGLIKLARNSGEIADVWAEVVYEKDVFDYELGLNPTMKHKRYDGDDDAGKLRFAYAVARFRDGERKFIVLNKKDIDKARSVSKSAHSEHSPWKKWEPEMWKKTAVRRLCKLLPLSVEVQEHLHEQDDQTTSSRIDVELPPLIEGSADDGNTVDAVTQDADPLEVAYGEYKRELQATTDAKESDAVYNKWFGPDRQYDFSPAHDAAAVLVRNAHKESIRPGRNRTGKQGQLMETADTAQSAGV